MKKSILLIACFIMAYTMSGCIALTLKINEDGVSIGAETVFPDIPEYELTKSFFSE